MDYDLKKLKLLARGGEAEIYEIGDGKILRVLTRKNAKASDTEKILAPVLSKHGVMVPKIYEYLTVGGMPAEIMQKISGQDMISYLKSHPFSMKKLIKKLAQMHAALFDIHCGGLQTFESRIEYFTAHSPVQDKPIVDFVKGLYASLPGGDSLCHSDFHPGNILLEGSDCYIIDWAGAYAGNYLSDVTHTYLLMKLMPKVPGQSRFSHFVLRIAGSMIAKTYLKEIHRLKGFSMEDFSKWTVIMAFLRICYGLPSEKEKRLEYLKKCFSLKNKENSAALFYKNI